MPTTKPSFSKNQKNLIKRYLLWCYKTTKEDLDRVDRYFTQNVVDDFLFNVLTKSKDFSSAKANEDYKAHIFEFEQYKTEKFKKAEAKKFLDKDQKQLHPDYLYLTNRLNVIEQAIVHFLGKKELENIIDLYETEMTERILTAREHT